MNPYVQKIGHIIGEIPIIGLIKPLALMLINPYAHFKRNKDFLKKGLNIISEFDTILTSNSIDYSIVFGTLLGAIREGGFIKHDCDFDIGVWHDVDRTKMHNVLIKNGFKLVHCYETDNGDFGREETYLKDGVSIDVFYFYPFDDTLAYTTVLVPFDGYNSIKESIEAKGGVMPIQLVLPFSLKTERIAFENIQLSAMSNGIEFIEARYGKNWRIPDPTFVYPKMGDATCYYRNDKLAKSTI